MKQTPDFKEPNSEAAPFPTPGMTNFVMHIAILARSARLAVTKRSDRMLRFRLISIAAQEFVA
jgi:hypothetical protein